MQQSPSFKFKTFNLSHPILKFQIFLAMETDVLPRPSQSEDHFLSALPSQQLLNPSEVRLEAIAISYLDSWTNYQDVFIFSKEGQKLGFNRSGH